MNNNNQLLAIEWYSTKPKLAVKALCQDFDELSMVDSDTQSSEDGAADPMDPLNYFTAAKKTTTPAVKKVEHLRNKAMKTVPKSAIKNTNNVTMNSNSSSVVVEDLSQGVEFSKLRVLNQYNGRQMKPFQYIATVEMVPRKLFTCRADLAQSSSCPSSCYCYYDLATGVLRFCSKPCACGTESCPLKRTPPSNRFQVFFNPNPVKGWSLQTLDDIEPETLLFEYAGQMTKCTDGETVDNDDYIIGFEHEGEHYMVDAHTKGNLARFVNHSCQPNCYATTVNDNGGVPHVLIFALKEICAGEELVMDYGENWWIAKAGKLDGCHCMSDSCKYDAEWCAMVEERYGAKVACKTAAKKVAMKRTKQFARKNVEEPSPMAWKKVAYKSAAPPPHAHKWAARPNAYKGVAPRQTAACKNVWPRPPAYKSAFKQCTHKNVWPRPTAYKRVEHGDEGAFFDCDPRPPAYKNSMPRPTAYKFARKCVSQGVPSRPAAYKGVARKNVWTAYKGVMPEF